MLLNLAPLLILMLLHMQLMPLLVVPALLLDLWLLPLSRLRLSMLHSAAFVSVPDLLRPRLGGALRFLPPKIQPSSGTHPLSGPVKCAVRSAGELMPESEHVKRCTVPWCTLTPHSFAAVALG